MKEGLRLYGPFITAADLPVGTWFIPRLDTQSDVPMAYRANGHVSLFFPKDIASCRHRGALGEVKVHTVVAMPSQSPVPMCALPLAEWLEWAWVRFDGITGEACLSHLKEEVRELDEALGKLNRAKSETSDIKVLGPLIDKAGEEAADVIALALHTGLRLFGTNLPVFMRDKLAINRERDWAPRADGGLRHVEPAPECGCDQCENGNGCEPQRRTEAEHRTAEASADALRDARELRSKIDWLAVKLGYEFEPTVSTDEKLNMISERVRQERDTYDRACRRAVLESAPTLLAKAQFKRSLALAAAREDESALSVLRPGATLLDALDPSDDGAHRRVAEALDYAVEYEASAHPAAEALKRVTEAGKLGDGTPEQHADRIVKKLERFDEYRKRSVILAAIEGMLGRGQDEPIEDTAEAQAVLRHHVGSAVLASLASAVRAEEYSLEAVQVAAARLMEYGRYRDTNGIALADGQIVSTPGGDTMRIDRVFLVDPGGAEVRDASSGLTWAAAGTVLTGFGGARTVVVQGPLTFLGWG